MEWACLALSVVFVLVVVGIVVMGYLDGRTRSYSKPKKVTFQEPPAAVAQLDPWSPERRILKLNDAGDYLTLKDLLSGTFITGQNGSGKTSSSGAHIARALLKRHFGGLVLCVKTDEPSRWSDYAKAYNRSQDVIMFGPNQDPPCRFNVLDYMYRSGEHAGATRNIVGVLMLANEQDQRDSQGGDNKFFENSLKVLLTHAVNACRFAYECVDLELVDQIIVTCARSPQDLEYETWMAESFNARTMVALEDRLADLPAHYRKEAERALHYFLTEVPNTPDATLGSILSTYTATISPLLEWPFGDLLFSGQSTVTPETVFANNAIWVLDLPERLWGETGLKVQTIVKEAFFQAAERRDLSKYPHPVFVWADEFQSFVVSSDISHLATTRSMRVLPVCLTQNLVGLISKMGDETARSSALTVVSLLGVKIGHSNSDSRTNEFYSQIIGRHVQRLDVTSFGTGSTNMGESIHEFYALMPWEFTILANGGPPDWMCEAYIVVVGKRFRANEGKPYLKVTFQQILL